MNPQDMSGDEHRFSGPRPEFLKKTQRSVRYFPVTLRGVTIGYLWASDEGGAASYVRRLAAQDTDAGFDSAIFWYDRLSEACAEGLRPLEALRRWVGAPEDPVGGMIASDAVEESAVNPRAVAEIANPGRVDPRTYSDEIGGTWPDGTPFDRSKGWDPLVLKLEQPGFKFLTDSAVRYVPVMLGGQVLGYLWAAVDDDAADFMPRSQVGAPANLAMRPWIERLDQAKQEGLSPMEALRRWIGQPEDPDVGGIAAGAEIRDAPSVEALKEIASR
jgi:hypothetical protein